MPEVKKFVKEEVAVYGDVTVEYVGGLSPIFIEYDDEGNEASQTDLSDMKLKEMHDLLLSKGFQPTEKDEL